METGEEEIRLNRLALYVLHFHSTVEGGRGSSEREMSVKCGTMSGQRKAELITASSRNTNKH